MLAAWSCFTVKAGLVKVCSVACIMHCTPVVTDSIGHQDFGVQARGLRSISPSAGMPAVYIKVAYLQASRPSHESAPWQIVGTQVV